MLEFLKENWLPISTAIGTIWIWFSERQKRKTEGKVGINDATGGMQAMYDKFVDDADVQYTKLNNKIEKLELDALTERNILTEKLNKLQTQVENDKYKIINLEQKIAGYELAIKSYELKILDYEAQVCKLKEELKKQK